MQMTIHCGYLFQKKQIAICYRNVWHHKCQRKDFGNGYGFLINGRGGMNHIGELSG